MPEELAWARVVIRGPSGAQLVMVLAPGGRPDLSTIDGLALLQLAMSRVGGRVGLEEVSAPLRELLDLAGLCGQLGRQDEGRQELPDVEAGIQHRPSLQDSSPAEPVITGEVPGAPPGS